MKPSNGQVSLLRDHHPTPVLLSAHSKSMSYMVPTSHPIFRRDLSALIMVFNPSFQVLRNLILLLVKMTMRISDWLRKSTTKWSLADSTTVSI